MDFEVATRGKKVSASPPAKIAALDLESARSRFGWVHQEIDRLKGDAEIVSITTEDHLKGAVAMAGQAKSLGKKIDEQRRVAIEEPNGFVKAVNAFCKDFTSKLDAIESGLKRKIADYQYRLELERREAERKAQEAANKLQEQLNREAQEKKVAPVEVPMPVMPKADTVARAETGATAHVRKQWKGEIVIPGEVPREYCSPDQRKINEAVKAGLRSIPGVRIFEDIQSVIRT